MTTRLVFLLRLDAGGHSGWGECVAWEVPLYSYETVGTASHVIRDYLGPAILGQEIRDLDDLTSRLGAFRGHPMAKAGIELAFVDLVARLRGESIARVIGGVRDTVEVGVSLGIQPSVEALDERVRALSRSRLPPHQAQDQAGRRRRGRRRDPPAAPADRALGRRQRGLHSRRRGPPPPARRLRPADDRAAAGPRRPRGPRPPAARPLRRRSASTRASRARTGPARRSRPAPAASST